MKSRSHWGWGDSSKYPGPAGRAAIGGQLEGLLGIAPRFPKAEPSLKTARIPDATVDVPADLAKMCSTRREARIRHTYGRSFSDQIRGFRGEFDTAPDVVATPADEADITRVLAWASEAGLAVVPFGGGTSVVGGVECRGDRKNGVVSLDLHRLSEVLEVDEVSGLARVQAGTLGPKLEAGLKPYGLTLRHFPQSFEFSTLGGWIATRAGGHFATLYTHIDDLTASVRMISPGTGVWESRCLPGSGAGPSPDRLVLGSEGTLGVITEAWMRVRPRPRWRASASVEFDHFEDAVDTARALAQSGLYPSNCRLLDTGEATLNFVATRNVLLIAFESADHPVTERMARALEIAQSTGGELTRPATYRDTESGRDKTAGGWRDAFLAGPYMQSTLIALGMVVDTFETACTWRAFGELHGQLQAAVGDAMQRVSGGGRLTCRFTHVYPDGPAPYYTFIAAGKKGGRLEQWAEIKQAASDALIRCGATITHHHAVGRTHQPWYAQQRPAPFGDVLRAVKGVLDPNGILNPGVLI